MGSRVFRRLSACATPGEAIDEAAGVRAIAPPRLHRCESEAVVGAVEIEDPGRVMALCAGFAGDLEARALELVAQAEDWRQ